MDKISKNQPKLKSLDSSHKQIYDEIINGAFSDVDDLLNLDMGSINSAKRVLNYVSDFCHIRPLNLIILQNKGISSREREVYLRRLELLQGWNSITSNYNHQERSKFISSEVDKIYLILNEQEYK
jgi:hypothetical protein